MPSLETARADAPLAGYWVTVGHPEVAEVVAGVGFDFVVLEEEHRPNSLETLADLLRGVEAVDPAVETIVRVADGDPTRLKRVLDLGVDGVLVPMVETAAEAESVVAGTRYPPEGVRGLGGSRANAYGRDVAAYRRRADDDLVRLVQIETERAVENAADIAAVDGVDGVFVGPADLSLSLGVFGEWEHERFTRAVGDVVGAAHGAGVGVGTAASGARDVADRLDWGMDFVVAGVDATDVRRGAAAALDACREY